MEFIDGLGIAANINFSSQAENIGIGLLKRRSAAQITVLAVPVHS
jgi:hypothetical protein